MKKVSVIIPVYNGADYLAEAIESALNQTYSNIEILVINDGSNDGGKTREIALGYGDRVRYFEKENGGVSTALNFGIEKMKGEYFSWLSHDDLYLPNKISEQMLVVEAKQEEVVVYSDFELLEMPERIVIGHYPFKKKFGEDLMSNGLLAVSLGLISGCTLLIPKKMFDINGGFDPSFRAVQDYLKWYEMFSDCRIEYVDKVLVQSRVHGKQQGLYLGKRTIEEGNYLYKRIIDDVYRKNELSLDNKAYNTIGAIISHIANVYEEGYRDAVLYGEQCLKRMKEPKKSEEQRRQLQKRLTNNRKKKICLYCCGRRGKRIKKDLERRGIIVDSFSDTNQEYWNTEIEGVICRRPEEIKNGDYRVVVTKMNADELVETLRQSGFNDVINSEDIEKDILFTPIDKRYL